MNPRVSSALIIIPFVLLLIVLGRIYLAVMIFILGMMCINEFYKLAELSGYSPLDKVGIIGVAAFTVIGYLGLQQAVDIVVAVVFIASMVWQVLTFEDRNPIADSAITLFGSIYVGLPLATGLLLRCSGDNKTGLGYFLTAILTIWATDIGAYYGGRTFGKHKLSPKISPNKTYEGAISGLVCGIIVGVAARSFGAVYMWWPNLNPVHSIMLALIASVFGQIGDLSESAFKRNARVKDSGVFMPGHGGVLDRLDSLLLAIPMVYYYVRLFLS